MTFRHATISTIATLLLAATVLRPAANAAPPQWSLITAQLQKDGSLTTYSNVALSQLALHGTFSGAAEAHIINISTAKIVSLQQNGVAAAPTLVRWRLMLRNGDTLVGSPLKLAAGTVQIVTPLLGTVKFPVRLIAGLRRAGAHTPKSPAADHDTIYFANGDKLAGIVDGLSAHHIIFHSSLGDTKLPLAHISVITLGGESPAQSAASLRAVITLRDASRITVDHLRWQAGQLHAQDAAGDPLVIAVANVLSINILGGRLQWLADVPFTQFQDSIFGMNWPARINASVTGKPLQVGSVIYRHGIGVHVNSVLRFKLDGQYKVLRIVPAMDNSAQPWGRAQLRILADGKPLYTIKNALPGQEISPVVLSVAGIKILQLSAVDDQHDGVLGRVDWASAALLK